MYTHHPMAAIICTHVIQWLSSYVHMSSNGCHYMYTRHPMAVIQWLSLYVHTSSNACHYAMLAVTDPVLSMAATPQGQGQGRWVYVGRILIYKEGKHAWC